MNGYREILAEKIKYVPDDKVGELIHMIDFFIKKSDTEKKEALLSISDTFVSQENTVNLNHMKKQTKLLDLFGAWEGKTDTLLHEFLIHRERRGRIE